MLIVFALCGCENRNEHAHDIPTPEINPDLISEPSEGTIENNNDDSNNLNSYDFVLAFAGDINFDEDWSTMMYYDTAANGIYDCISPELIQMMQDADIMCINNEFTYSTGGAPMSNKAYTFRAHPSRVDILKELGVDIVSLANNHVYDYGEHYDHFKTG